MIRKLYLLTIVAIWCVSCTPVSTDYERAQGHLYIGMLRDDAITLASTDAWYYQPCKYGNTVVDLFFFGSHSYDRAEILIVTSAEQRGSLVVEHVGTFEPNAWHTAYSDCIDRKQFED